MQNIDVSRPSESGDASTSTLPGSFSVPTTRSDASKSEKSLLTDDRSNSSTTHQDLADGALRRVGHAAEYFVILTTHRLKNLSPFHRDIILLLNNIRRSSSDVWQSLSKVARVDPDRLLSAVVIT